MTIAVQGIIDAALAEDVKAPTGGARPRSSDRGDVVGYPTWLRTLSWRGTSSGANIA